MLPFLSLIQMASATPHDYAFLSNKGVLYVQVFKAPTLAADLSHNHAIQAVGWSGKGSWDADDYSKCNISISVPVNNLQVDTPFIRNVAGLNGTISDSMRKDVKKHMLSKTQLHAEEYPMITFQSTGCEESEKGIVLEGDFTMHGTTQTVSVPVTIKDSDGFNIKGSFTVKATDYGIQPYSAMFGAVGNKDEMKITFDLVAAEK